MLHCCEESPSIALALQAPWLLLDAGVDSPGEEREEAPESGGQSPEALGWDGLHRVLPWLLC